MATIKRFSETLATSDIKLASSLLAAGCAPVPGEEVSMADGADGTRVSFNFLPHGEVYRTADLMEAWKREATARKFEEGFIATNPEHPMAYLMAGWRNYMHLREYVMRGAQKYYLRKGRSIALIGKDLERAHEEHILGKIGL